MKTKKWLGILSSVGLPLLFGVVIFVQWQKQVLHSWLGTDTITLLLPTRIGEIISQNKDSIGSQVKMTLIVALGGLAAGSVLGYLIAVVASIFRKWGAGGLTIVSAFNAIPIVALAPVINNWTRDVNNDVSVRSTLAKIIVMLGKANDGIINFEKAVELCSTNPAKIFGCTEKGEITPGKDTDIVIYDPAKEFTIHQENMHSDCDHTIWEGVTVHGYPVQTYSRRKLVFDNGEFVGERGWGKFVKCAGHKAK